MSHAIKHKHWSGAADFFLTSLGSAIGIAKIWRLPSLVYKHGGGVFFISQFICLTLLGIPLLLLEFAMGQFSSLGPTKVWKIAPIWKGIGLCSVIQLSVIAIWYNVPITYSLYFLGMSMTSSELPWRKCSKPWAGENCLNLKLMNDSSIDAIDVSKSDSQRATRPSEDYFFNEVLGISSAIDDYGMLRWQMTICSAVVWLVVFLICIKGTQSYGKIAYFTTIFPFIIQTIMLGFALTLDGAGEGVAEYFSVDGKWHRLGDPVLWRDAITQATFSLSIGCGGQIALSSYNSYHNNILRDAMLIPMVDFFASIYSGLAVFGTLGFMAKMTNSSVAQVVSSGPGLAFVTYPEALGLFEPPWVGVLMSILFFLMMVILGVPNQSFILETMSTVITDEIPALSAGFWRPASVNLILVVTLWLCGLIFFFESGFYYFQLFDSEVIGWGLIVVAFGETLIISWIYSATTFWKDIEMMIGEHRVLRWFFEVAWRVITPLVILIIFCFNLANHQHLTTQIYINEAYRFPDWSYTVSVPLIIIPIAFIPIHFAHFLLKDTFRRKLREGNTAKGDWVQANEETRKRRRMSKNLILRLPVIANRQQDAVVKMQQFRRGIQSAPELNRYAYDNRASEDDI